MIVMLQPQVETLAAIQVLLPAPLSILAARKSTSTFPLAVLIIAFAIISAFFLMLGELTCSLSCCYRGGGRDPAGNSLDLDLGRRTSHSKQQIQGTIALL